MMYNFACVCYGDKYPVEYVQKLYNMVTRNTTLHINFFVFTDHVKMEKMIDGNINVSQFPEHDIEGWWNKLQLFHPKVSLPGDTLYMDLDVVITDNIDCFFEYEPEADFIGMNDFNPDTKIFNSSIMKFKPEAMKDALWQPFIAKRLEMTRLAGDQNVISNLIYKAPTTRSFPDSWTQSYKWYDRSGTRYHKGKWTFEHNGESLVTVFHGEPNPHQSEQEWVKKAWI